LNTPAIFLNTRNFSSDRLKNFLFQKFHNIRRVTKLAIPEFCSMQITHSRESMVRKNFSLDTIARIVIHVDLAYAQRQLKCKPSIMNLNYYHNVKWPLPLTSDIEAPSMLFNRKIGHTRRVNILSRTHTITQQSLIILLII
jgi:hypothetical protein